MYAPNVKPSEQIGVVALIPPADQAAGAAVSGWIPAGNFQRFLAVIALGVIGANGTIDAKFQQATDNAGTGAKDVVGAALTQVEAAGGNNVVAELNLDVSQLDADNNFGFIQLSVTAGVASTYSSALLLGFEPRFAPASAYNIAGVTQIAN